MSSSLTSRLGLAKPDPGTGEPVNVATQINASWDKIDAAVGAEPALSTALPGTPFHGKLARGTDNRKTYVWNATQGVWDQLLTGPGNLVTVDSTGKLQFGAGAGTYDTNLYRSAANVLSSDDTFVAAGVISGQTWESIRIVPSSTITNQTETVIQTLTFPAVSGASYMVTAMQNVQSSLVNDLVRIRLKWQSGTSLTAGSSTKLFTTLSNCDVVGRGAPVTLNKVFTPNVTGNVTVGITFQRESASPANVLSYGEADRSENSIIVAGA